MDVYLATITKKESGPCDVEDCMVEVFDKECIIDDWICLDGSDPGFEATTFEWMRSSRYGIAISFLISELVSLQGSACCPQKAVFDG